MRARPGPRVLVAAAVLVIVAALAWLVSTQGPLAPTRVTIAKVEQGALTASTFGIGTVEARSSHALGPTNASRVVRVLVDQGDAVRAGQVLAELDPVDLVDRERSGEWSVARTASAVHAAEAQLAEARSRADIAAAAARRQAELEARGFVSREAVDGKEHEAKAAQAGVDAALAQLAAARRDLERARADLAGIGKLRTQMRLVSPVDGVVSARLVEPGTTVVAGQAVVQVIDPASLWVKARIDQGRSNGLRVGQPAEVVLRSDAGRVHGGDVRRVDWVSDPVTEERIVNVGFGVRPDGLAVGDLAEVTIRVAELADARSLPAAAVKRLDRQDGVWLHDGGRVVFRPVRLGITTLDGRTQVLDGVTDRDEVIVHSERTLRAGDRVKVVDALVKAP